MSKGIVGVIANDSARYSLFASCIDRLILPQDWRKEWLIGGDWCGARNELCRLVLQDEEAEYLWFMDDDHAFPPTMLTKLLAHEEALVTPICLTRVHPFAPVQYVEKVGDAQYLPIKLSDSGWKGLVEIQAGGCAGMLIRRDVIEAIEPPWFEYTDRSEDIIFCEKAKAAGFKLHADLETTLGHITTAVVHPTIRDEEWKVGLTIGRDLNLIVDTADTVVAEQPGAPAQVQTWIWTVRRVLDDTLIYQLYLPANTPFNWVPHLAAPRGILQWYCDEGLGEGPKPVGDPFSFYEESA
jgi:Glycosyl transferase family 2